GGEYGGAAHLARRVPGVRVDDVVVAHAVLVEKALVVSGCGHRRIREWNACDHLVRVVRMADGDEPWPTHAIADDVAVAPGSHQRARNAARFEDLDTAVDRVAFTDAAQVDAHAGMLEAYGAMRLIEQHVAPVDGRQLCPDLCFGRVDVIRVVVEIADAR